MSALAPLLENALDAIRDRNEYRQMTPGAIAADGRLERGGRIFLDFSSNDYLGLARHPLLIERASEWSSRLGAGAGASRLVAGTTDMHVAVEARVAAFKGAEAALLFASGWQANAAVIPTLLRAAPNALVFTDRLIHSSLHHGCAAAGVKQIRFRHNDLDHLDELLRERSGDVPKIIITESLFSMDGDVPDIGRLADIADAHDAFVYLDEAHATGVRGPSGAGLSPTVPGRIGLSMGTFSKAMGSFGAYVAGSRLLCDYLINACGGFIFTTALPPPVLGAIDAALDLVPGMDAERAKLERIGDDVRASLRGAGFDVGGSSSHIVPAIIGNAERTLALSRQLEEAGIIAAAIRPPTVPPGASRIRLALRATHDQRDIDRLLSVLTRVAADSLSQHS